MELMTVINEETFRKFPILKTCGNKYYQTWMSSHFKPRSSYASQKLYTEGDVIDDFYFST